MRINRTSLTRVSLALTVTGGALVLMVPGSARLFSQTPKAPHVLSPDDVQRDVDAMNASLQRSQQAFEKSMSRPGPSDNQIALYQAEADRACVCTDRSGPKAEARCWARYRAMTKPFRPEQLTAACMFRTTVVDMFPGGKSVSLNQCTADREAAELAKAAGAQAAGAQPDEC
jgi:hypothetical protein